MLDRGRRIGGRYEVSGPFERASSENSKLITFEGRDSEDGREILVVVLRPELFRDEAIRSGYLYGLERIRALDHPGIMRIHATELDEARSELIFVTDRVPWHSVSLARLLREGAIFGERQLVRMMREYLEALAHAHERGIVFANVKPSNILVVSEEHTIINGLPKPPLALSSVQQIGAYLGYPFACAPEVLDRGTFDARADVYGAGLVLYEICAGRLPIHGSNNLGVMFKEIIHDPWPPLASFNPDVSPRLADVVDRAVDKRPEHRFADAADMLEALARVPGRDVPLITRDRLRHLVHATMPFPIAETYASIEHQIDDAAILQRVVDAAHVAIQLLAVIVLSSRAGKSPIPENVDARSLARPSLGHWVAILREGLRAGGITVAPELASLYFDARGRLTDAADAVNALVALRNEVRHGASLTVTAARKRLDAGRAHLETLLSSILFLRGYRMFVPRDLDYEEGRFSSEVVVLRGASTSFSRQRVSLSAPVSVGKVYFADDRFERVVSLYPLVIREGCPVCEDDELFFFESASDRRAHYMSFQKGHCPARDEHLPALERAGLI
jgi:serine/threonine protein kinase